MQPETRFKNKVISLLKLLPNTWYFKSHEKSLRGIPDLIICINGKFVAWELKVKKNKPDPLQVYTMEAICKAKGYSWSVTPDNLEKSLLQLQKIGGMEAKTILQLEQKLWE